jgi:diguanylate cyclase (GGDEF)-like protein/MYXO-CTERM domain-containing protein
MPAESVTPPPQSAPAEAAPAQASVDPLADAVASARASGDATAQVQALLALADARLAQSRGAEATATIEEAARLAAQVGDDRLGREAALAGVSAYEQLGDGELAQLWRNRADAYRERIEGNLAPVPELPAASSAVVPAPDATPADANAAAAAPGESPAPLWPWILVAVALVLAWAWRRSHRRAAALGDEAERLARHQRHLRHAHQELQRQAEHLRQTATQDALTGALTRTAFAHGLEQMLQHAQRFGQPVALFVFDLDHFKQVNDTHGHLAGDEALKLVVGVSREKLDSADLLGRFGGDEFLVAAIRDRVGEFPELAESLRAALRARVAGDPKFAPLSLSLGIAVVDGGNYSADALFARADTALYAAKRGGRDRCVLADARPAEPTAETPLRTLAG